MLNRKISRDHEVAAIANDLGCDHALFLTWAIAHLDRDGRIDADPEVLRGMVTPLIAGINSSTVSAAIDRAGETGLVDVYEDERGRRFMVYPKFAANQVGLRHDREPASDFPDPEDCRKVSGRLPEGIRKPSGRLPAEGKGIEGKEIEKKGRESKIASVPLKPRARRPGVEQVAECYCQTYPKNRAQAYRPENQDLIAARLADHTPDDLCRAIDGMRRGDSEWYYRKGLTELSRVVKDEESVGKFMALADAADAPVLTDKSRQTIDAVKNWTRKAMEEDDQK